MGREFLTKGDEVFLLTEDTKTVGLKEAVSQLSMTIYSELINIKEAEKEENNEEMKRLEEKVSFQSGVLDSLSNALKTLNGIREGTGLKMLNTLESIDGALKRIEQSLTAEKQHEVISSAVSHALLGGRYNSTPKDDE